MPREDAFDVVVVGGANYDYLARGPELPKAGVTAKGDFIHDGAGGKGANQAVGAARLGARAAFVGRIGRDDRGTRILAAFQREKIDTTRVICDGDAPTGVALVQVNAAGEKQILAVHGANERLTPADVRAAGALIAGARVLLLQLEIPLESTLEAARIAHEAGVKIVLDPAPAIPLPDELLRIVNIIKPNAGEARVITGIEVKDRASAREAGRKLLERGAAAAAVTAGSEGNLLIWSDGECWLPRIPVKSIDATGAGDAFAAAFGVMLAKDRSLAEAGAFANAAAALATTVVGAQDGLPARDAVLALQKDSKA